MTVVIIHKFFCGFGMKLLMVNDSILKDGKVMPFAFLRDDKLFLFEALFTELMMLNIAIFDFDDIFLVLVDCGQELSLYLAKVLANFVLIEEAGLLLEDEICMTSTLPERIYISSAFFFFMVEFQ